MVAIDTNVLIRFLTQDDPAQCKIVNQFFSKIQNSDQTLFICQIVLCEVEWVLRYSYDQTKNQIVEVLQDILTTPYFVFENVNTIWDALNDFREATTVGFADCLIGRNNEKQGNHFTYTFDVKASKQLKSFKLLTD